MEPTVSTFICLKNKDPLLSWPTVQRKLNWHGGRGVGFKHETGLGPQRTKVLNQTLFSSNGPCAVKIKSKHYNFTHRKVTNTLGIFRNSCKSGFTSDKIGVNYQQGLQYNTI